MAGYSGTPLAKKLGIKGGHRLLLAFAPTGFTETLGELPPGVSVSQGTRGTAVSGTAGVDVLILFASSRAVLEKSFEKAIRRVYPAGSVWVAWPKKSSGVVTDMNEHVARDVGLPLGVVDNKVCAIDETWSGLRFVWRLENR